MPRAGWVAEMLNDSFKFSDFSLYLGPPAHAAVPVKLS